MEPQDRTDPLARERARKRRAKQVQRRRLVAVGCLLGLIILIVALVVGLSGDDQTGTTSTTESTETTSTTESTETTDGETTSTGEITSTTFSAELTGDQSLPPVATEARATLTLGYDADAETLTYVLDVVSALTNPSSATIYEGSAGTSGAAIVTLFPGPTATGSFTGVLAEGFIEEADLIGSLQGQTLADLVALLESGGTYVSIGNESHPIDAIRGQIE
jgi:hypothetical protein